MCAFLATPQLFFQTGNYLLCKRSEGNQVREFHSQLPHPVLVGIEAIGPMQWFLNLMDELRVLLLHPHQWVRVRTRVQNALQNCFSEWVAARSWSVELRWSGRWETHRKLLRS